MKILIAHLGTNWVAMPGGVEKVTCELANALVDRGHEVTVLYRDGKKGNPYFPLDNKVKQVNILYKDDKQVIPENLPTRLRIMREVIRLFSQSKAQGINAKYKGRQYGLAINQYLNHHTVDVVISCSIPSAKYMIDDGKCQAPVIEMLHAQPSVQFPILSDLERAALAKCKILQLLLPSGVKLAHQYFPDLPVVVIGNAVNPIICKANLGVTKKQYKIICVGNISPRKSQHLLVQAFARLAGRYKEWSLELWGGAGAPYARKLKIWIKQHHMDNCIHVNGTTSDIAQVYGNADIFCLPSRDEGFPLALVEAMSAGLPVVGFEDGVGVSDLIENGATGLLSARSVEALAKTLEVLITDSKLRESLGNAGMKSIEKYSPERIYGQWEELLQSVVNGKYDKQ